MNAKYLLKSFYQEKLTFTKLWFSTFKKFVTRSVPKLMKISLHFKTSCCNLKLIGLVAKLCVIFQFFNFERCYVLKSENPSFVEQKYKLKKTKWKFQHTVLERQTLCFSSCKNHKFKKLWWVRACKRKKRAFFVPFLFSEGHFLRFVFYLNV